MNEQMIDELARLFSEPRSERETAVFLQGMLTPAEIEEVFFRWRLMRRLMHGETQRAISSALGVSLGKIARGSRLLKYGPPAFRELLERFDSRLEEPGA